MIRRPARRALHRIEHATRRAVPAHAHPIAEGAQVAGEAEGGTLRHGAGRATLGRARRAIAKLGATLAAGCHAARRGSALPADALLPVSPANVRRPAAA